MVRCRSRDDKYELLRQRMCQETEVALLFGLRFPERVARISTVEGGRGRFTRQFAARFWHETLGITYPEYMSAERLDRWAEPSR